MDPSGVKKASIFALAAISAIYVGCGQAAAPNSPSPKANLPENAAPSRPSVQPEASAPQKGVKVDKPETVKFPGGSLPDGWKWIDPDRSSPTEHDFKNGRLSMKVVPPKDLYGNDRSAPRMLKAINGDFQLEARVKFAPESDYQGAGLLIFADGEHYVRLERCFGGIGGGGSGIRFDVRQGNEYTPVATPIDIPTQLNSVEIKLTRRLNVISAYWREDENGEWRAIDDVSTHFPETVEAGVSASTTATEIPVEFSWIRLSPQPAVRPF